MGDRLYSCDRFLSTCALISGLLSKGPFEDFLGEVYLQLEHQFSMCRYLDIDGFAADELQSRATHATHHFKVVGSVGHQDRTGISDGRIHADHQCCLKSRVPHTTRFHEVPPKTMIWLSKKGHDLVVDDFEAIVPDIWNASFRIFADNDPRRDVRSTIFRAIFGHR